MPHLFVDISAHGLGHLAQVAPVLEALSTRCPGLRLTIRSGLPPERLEARIRTPFTHIRAATDFGFRMIDALRIDHPTNIAAYREFHADWPGRLEREAALLERLSPDFILADVSCLPLAAAATLGIPAAAMCSLNWADLFGHYYGDEEWAAPILATLRAAYASAPFLRLRPAMTMDWIPERVDIGPVACRGLRRREEIRQRLGLGPEARLVILALGGIPTRLPVERWLGDDDLVWLVPADWGLAHRRCPALESLAWPFADVLASADALVTKPGYGSFTEAACNGTPLAYLRRDDWPEQEALIEWIHRVGRAIELRPETLAAGTVGTALDALWAQPVRPPVPASGNDEAAAWLAARLVPRPREHASR